MTILTIITKISGAAIAGFPPEIEISSMVCIYVISKKYTFGAFENYVNKFNGRKVNGVYLAVLMVLSPWMRFTSVLLFVPSSRTCL